MRERIRPTRSGLFAIELTLAVGVFTLCAAICTGIFAQSEVMSQDSEALSRAVNEARNIAELARTAQLSGGEIITIADGGEIIETALADNSGAVTDSGAVLSRMYDAQWMETESPFDAAYQIFLTPKTESAGYVSALLQAVRTDGKVLLEWEIAALEAVS